MPAGMGQGCHLCARLGSCTYACRRVSGSRGCVTAAKVVVSNPACLKRRSAGGPQCHSLNAGDPAD